MSGSGKNRIRGQRKVVTIILLLCALLALSIGLLFKEKDLKTIMLAIGAGLFAGAFIARAFSRKFGYKPTREEIEEKMFEK